MKTKYFIPIIFLLLFTRCSTNSNADLKNFPEGYTPEEVGTRISKRFISGKHMLHKKNGKDGIHYAEVCTWYGALKYAVAVGDKALIKQLQNKFEPLFTTEANYQPLMNHVDLNMFGCLPFEFYQITKINVTMIWGFLMQTRNGRYRTQQQRKKRTGPEKVSPGKPVYGSMICL